MIKLLYSMEIKHLPAIKRLMLPGKYIPELIGYALCLSDQFIDVPVGMSVNPTVSPTGLDKVIFI